MKIDSISAEILGMETPLADQRRASSAITPQWLEPDQTSVDKSKEPPPAADPALLIRPKPVIVTPEEEAVYPPAKFHIPPASSDMPKIQLPAITRHRATTDTNFENTETEELIAMLRETENLEEQGDILQYLVDTQGLDFNTGKCEGIFLNCVRFSLTLTAGKFNFKIL
jgi:phosphorylase kinase alpha/beta subunit